MDSIAANDYHELVQVGEPRLSPDGSEVAFVHTVPDGEEEYESTVHVVPADGGEPRRFTAGPVDGQPRWSPDGDRLAFVRTDGESPPQLFVLPVDGGEARQVTDVAGGVESVAWAPDGERLAFTQSSTPEERRENHDLEAPDDYEREDPDPRVVDRTVYRAHERYFDGARSHVYVTDLGGGVERLTDGEYEAESPHASEPRERGNPASDHTQPAWGDDRTLYYAVKRGEDPDDAVEYEIESVDPETGEVESVTTTQGWDVLLAASEDGRLAYSYTPEPVSLRQVELEVYDPETGETSRPTAGFDRTVDLRHGISWGEGGLYFVAPDEGAFTVCRATDGAASGDDVDGDEGVEQVVVEGHATGATAANGRVAFTRSAWDHRGDVFVHEDGETRRLTEVNSDLLEDREVREPEELRFESDGHEIQGWLLLPGDGAPSGSGEQFPLAVEVHGGPHAMWSTSGSMFHEFQTLAARGYAVFWCNPRGSTGYGEDFATAIERDWGAVTEQDVLAGVEAACEHDAVDGDEIHLTGGSFGGFMTAWLVAHDDRFRSAVAQRGVYELPSFYGTTDAYKLVEGDFDATPWADNEFLWAQSPVAETPNVETPTLLVHAENDYRVPVSQAEVLFRFLRKQGVDTRLVRYPREGHELSRSGEPGHVVDRIERIVRWFDGYSDRRDVPRSLDRGADGLSAGAADEEGTD